MWGFFIFVVLYIQKVFIIFIFMKPFEKYLTHSSILRDVLDTYLELRLHLQELGFSEDELDSPPKYTSKMMNLQERFNHELNNVIRFLRDYGFEVSRDEVADFIMPQLYKINELTPLRDGNTERRDSGDEDY
jgi:hypothetical protein